jgi:hypothetical protein
VGFTTTLGKASFKVRDFRYLPVFAKKSMYQMSAKEKHMIESILTIISLLLIGACVGVGVIIAILYFSMDKD